MSAEMELGTIVVHDTKRKFDEEESEATPLRDTKRAFSVESVLSPLDLEEPCQECQELILKWKEVESKKIIRRQVIAQWVVRRGIGQAFKCAMCSMIRSLQIDSFRGKKIASYHLLVLPNTAFDAGFTVFRKQKIHNCTYLGAIAAGKRSKETLDLFINSGCIGNVDRTPLSATTVPGSRYIGSAVDWNRLKGWVDICRDTHESHSKSRNTGTDRKMSFLKVIDCASIPPVVLHASEGCIYIALSYVWGKSKHNSSGDNTKQQECFASGQVIPQTILDAVETVRRLGFRYLWVDQYVPAVHVPINAAD
jgi:hypothetical protein